jgi:hypothetical protein
MHATALAAVLCVASQLGEWGSKAKSSLDSLSKVDVKTQEAEQQCVASRTLITMADRKKEKDFAGVAEQIESICKLSDVWAPLLRLVPGSEGVNRAGYCSHAKSLITKLKTSKADVAELEREYQKSCASAVRMDATGDLAGVAKMDPSSEAAIAICRDARIEAAQKNITDKSAGAAMDAKVDAACAIPDLWSSLRFASDQTKHQDLRDMECIAAALWIDTHAKSKKLSGKRLADAKKTFQKSCAPWKNVKPMKELAKLAKLDPKSEEARGLCVRANIWVFAHKVESERNKLDAERSKTCAIVEGWFNALGSSCLMASDQLEKKRALVNADDHAAMTKALKARCK